MALYAIVVSGVVTDLCSPADGKTIDQVEELTKAQLVNAVPIPIETRILPGVGWTYSDGVFAPPKREPRKARMLHAPSSVSIPNRPNDA